MDDGSIKTQIDKEWRFYWRCRKKRCDAGNFTFYDAVNSD